MSSLRAAVVLDTPLLRVGDVCCTASRSGWGPEESGDTAEIVLPRRGVFAVYRRGEKTLADAATALVLGGHDSPYRVSHPVEGGDLCTVLSVAPETLVDALGDTWPTRAALRPSTQIKVRLLAARLSPGRLPPVARVLEAPGTGSRRQGRCKGADGALLGAEDEALCLLDAVARDFTDAPPPRLGWAQRHRVEQVRELLATRPTDPWRLGDIADVVGCSPFHLARQFRAVTGESISRHLLLLRLALALDRIVGGERDLGQLATELGFASHSHLTSRFRRMFGTTPQRLRTIVTAPPDEHA